jgi:hypothetical protein
VKEGNRDKHTSLSRGGINCSDKCFIVQACRKSLVVTTKSSSFLEIIYKTLPTLAKKYENVRLEGLEFEKSACNLVPYEILSHKYIFIIL